MRELELDGIHDDGEHLLLVDSDGARYTLRIDRALRAAVRSDRPALNMIQAADAAPLRPREIQAMLRAGRSAEDIAEASEIPLEHVRRYEGPVLAEREWTAQRARTFPVGRGGPTLLDVVSERLAAREATGDSAWDAWRRQDGTWTLELSFSAGGRTRQAHWVADLDNRSVSPVDDEARWISDEDAPPEPTRGRGRLQAVKSSVYDLEADGSLEGPATAPRTRTWPPRQSVADEHPSVIDDEDLEALNARRGLRSVPRPEDSGTVWSGLEDSAEDAEATEHSPTNSTEHTADAADAAGAGEAASEAPAPAGSARPGTPDEAPESALGETIDSDTHEDDPDREAELEHSVGLFDVETAEPEVADPTSSEHAPGSADSSEASQQSGTEGDDQQADEHVSAPVEEIGYQDTVDLTPLPGFDDPLAPSSPEDDAPEEKPAKKPRPRSKRASMPSWDEIVFGSKHD
ncbi:septation protein SepH [Brachybacterium sp.]|uniref:septation protein SepH n=1 Tax=Brachybacterium sp. TaxID=1891286 RepID=UPI002ED53567